MLSSRCETAATVGADRHHGKIAGPAECRRMNPVIRRSYGAEHNLRSEHMTSEAAATTRLSDTVQALKVFFPAKDFEVSKSFYADLGFEITLLEPNLAKVALGAHSFLLQNYYVADWAGNFMMHLLVDDLDAWWSHIAHLDLRARYGVPEPKAPKLEAWGLRTAYVIDPAGVLWHIAELPRVQ
jgi:catechol 2,3-dioxygenase-like lactoylglutathione lyase family enzyme